MEKIKELLSKDKKTGNLILIGVLLVIVLIFMDYIFINEDETETTTVISKEVTEEESLETRLAKIINEISGVENANVLITYSSTQKVIPVYDTKEDTDTSTEDGKTSTKKTVEKTVAYEGEDKTALVESTENAQATGAIIVVSGNVTEDTKLKIKEAIAVVTNVPVHKIQIFVN